CTALLNRSYGRWAMGALIVVSVLNVWAQSIAGQYYPPYERDGTIITDPTFQYSLPVLLRGDVAENYGTVIGLRGFASLGPLALIASGLVLRLRSQYSSRGEDVAGGEMADERVSAE